MRKVDTLFLRGENFKVTQQVTKSCEWVLKGEGVATEKLDDMKVSDAIPDELETIKGEIENLRDETDDKLSNMPDSLQNSPTAELLQSRVDSLQEWYDNLDSIDTDIDEYLSKEEKEKRYQEILEDIQSKMYEGE